MTDTSHPQMAMSLEVREKSAGRNPGLRIVRALRSQPVWIIGFLVTAYFSIQSPFFLTPFNISNILLECALIGFLAVGLTPVIVSGNIDLSVGSVVGLTACLAVGLQEYGLYTAIFAALGAGLLLGAINGLIIEKVGISSFIVTLAAMIGYRGLIYSYTGDNSLSPIDDRLSEFSYLSIGPLTMIPIFFLGSVVIFQIILKLTVLGRNAYAVGGNRHAAENAGVPVTRTIVSVFALSGLMAAVCGIAMAANLSAATPTFGQDYELWAVIAVVLGGARLRGGVGGLIGTLAAVVTLGVVRNGLNLSGVSPFLVPVIMGATLIAVLVADRQLNRNTRGLE